MLARNPRVLPLLIRRQRHMCIEDISRAPPHISLKLLGVRGRPEWGRGRPLGGHATGHGKYVSRMKSP